MQTIDSPILFVGGGNMAHAIISGAISAQTLNTDHVGVLDPNADRHSLFDNGFADTRSAFQWISDQERFEEQLTIVLAVKPQMLEVAAAPLREQLKYLITTPLIVSILAGTRSEQISDAFANGCRVIRVMPNTPAQLGLGMSAIAAGDSSTQSDLQLAEQLFSSVGKTIRISEDLMDSFTAVAGSGPAYIFYLAEAMINSAITLGFNREQAELIVKQTVFGSASLLEHSAENPGKLREMVTSKNGTTYAATTTLDTLGVMDAVVCAITAARDRGIELSQEA